MLRHLWKVRIWPHLIWHPDAIPASEGELARDVKRWVLPTIDALLILGCILGLRGGMPTVTTVYNGVVAQVAIIALLVCAVACLLGVSVPRWWALEMVAKIGLAFVLLTYAIMLLVIASQAPTRGVIAGVTAAAAVVPIWRIVWLGREHRRRVILARLERET